MERLEARIGELDVLVARNSGNPARPPSPDPPSAPPPARPRRTGRRRGGSLAIRSMPGSWRRPSVSLSCTPCRARRRDGLDGGADADMGAGLIENDTMLGGDRPLRIREHECQPRRSASGLRRS
ncbi:hypothetical protein ACMHYB_58180 [Sorangium sp. So ce1128]